jgi:poly-gamma-glutamate synthesis protein (capsule biosynthesis protein)
MNYSRFNKIILFALALLAITSLISTTDSPNLQPTDPKPEKKYLAFRAEGYQFSENALSGIKYFRKYLNKRIAAPDSITDYFRGQALLDKVLEKNCDEPSILSLAFVGDIMWIRDNWEDFLGNEVKSYLETKEMVFGNLETPVVKHMPVPSFWPDYVSYNSSPGLITSFNREDGTGNIFTALSITNNHALDRGIEGLAETIRFLEENGIESTGVTLEGESHEDYLRFSKNGVRIGFYASSWGLNNPEDLPVEEINMNIIPGIAPLDAVEIDLSEVTGVLSKMEQDGMDIKILSLHWGYEYEIYPDPEIMKIARRLAISGADIITGSHPHVLQPDEVCFINGYQKYLNPAVDDSSKYCFLSDSTGIPRKSLIIYSLGNFVTAMFTPLCRLGAIQSVNLYTNPVTGKTDWTVPEIRYVYNTPSDPEKNKRRLLFWDEYIKKLEQTSPSQAVKVKEETSVIFGLLN